MYTGELINELLENVQDAERKVFIKVSAARKGSTQNYDTYMYDFGREELVGVA
jgi:hypothetical protein